MSRECVGWLQDAGRRSGRRWYLHGPIRRSEAVREDYATLALALCGAGLGLAVPFLSDTTISPSHGVTRSGAWSIGARHVGLVVALELDQHLRCPEVRSDCSQVGCTEHPRLEISQLSVDRQRIFVLL